MSRTLLLAAVIALSPAVVFAQDATTTAPKSPAVTAEAPKAPAVKADEPKSPAVTATAPKSPAVSAPAATVAGDKTAPPAKAVKAVHKVKKSTTAAKATSKPATEEVKPAAPKADTHL
jgi:hypothetical protein